MDARREDDPERLRDERDAARREALALRDSLRDLRGWAEAKCIVSPDEADLEIRRIVRAALVDDWKGPEDAQGS